ncbi:MAG: hypothetical protein WA049_09405 [Ferribacterium limneticum]
MVRHYQQRSIGFNWPLFLGCIASLLIHGTIFVAWHPDSRHSASRTLLEIHFRILPPNLSLTQPDEGIALSSRNRELAKQPGGLDTPQDSEASVPAPQSPIYFPTHLMERRPFPVSAPTASKYLNKASLPAIVVRLRLFIDSHGKVVDIRFISPENLEEKVNQQISEMFFATSFVPGNIHGIDLPSYMDIELDLASYIE